MKICVKGRPNIYIPKSISENFQRLPKFLVEKWQRISFSGSSGRFGVNERMFLGEILALEQASIRTPLYQTPNILSVQSVQKQHVLLARSGQKVASQRRTLRTLNERHIGDVAEMA